MPLTPLEVRQHLLPAAKFRGYDRSATDEFVKRVGADYEALWTERELGMKRIAELEAELAARRGTEVVAAAELRELQEAVAAADAAQERLAELANQADESDRRLRDAANLEGRLRAQLTAAESELATYREREGVVAGVLITAEASAAEIRAAAEQEADALRAEAEAAAHEMRSAAEAEVRASLSQVEAMAHQIEEEAVRERERHETELERLRQAADETRESLSALLVDTLNRAGIDTHDLQELAARHRDD